MDRCASFPRPNLEGPGSGGRGRAGGCVCVRAQKCSDAQSRCVWSGFKGNSLRTDDSTYAPDSVSPSVTRARAFGYRTVSWTRKSLGSSCSVTAYALAAYQNHTAYISPRCDGLGLLLEWNAETGSGRDSGSNGSARWWHAGCDRGVGRVRMVVVRAHKNPRSWQLEKLLLLPMLFCLASMAVLVRKKMQCNVTDGTVFVGVVAAVDNDQGFRNVARTIRHEQD